ncbi:hypothetical protein [Agromyces binzhouensis]|uniref:Mucin-associated surface protein n=1 Tax=Agromyces binzhouensis TaxID=1817495 RepID=A0A4Q2JAA0_9MICO|nr:hypothetical protein [Agromyces binzhouensis]RXZ43238.1 hypothetical protein ESO86_15670 [Agromyces binzhouensis]
MTIRLRRALTTASVTVALAVGLAGCAAGPAISEGDATAFRAQVVSIAESSSTGDFADALARLDALQAEVDAAAADGSLDADRAASITEAIALVRADLEAAIAAATPSPEPTPTPTESESSDEGDDSDDGGPGSSGDNEGEGNSGEGNGDDKPGKGKGRDKGGD